MRTSRSLIIAASLAALLVTGLAVPVAAAKTKLAIVNGMPGKRVDVCVNGVEVKSGLRYGKFIFKTTKTAKATVKFYKRDYRRCGGKLLAKKTTDIDDATLVGTRRFPFKVVVFDNNVLAQPTLATWIRASYRHAADLGAVQFSSDLDPVDENPVDLAADTSIKGEKWHFLFVQAQTVWSTIVTQGGVKVVPPFFRLLDTPLRRWELILVGTNLANAKLVFINRPATPA